MEYMLHDKCVDLGKETRLIRGEYLTYLELKVKALNIAKSKSKSKEISDIEYTSVFLI